jgi:hypothetical protein
MPFKKGQSGNPAGRPRGDWTWAGMIRKAMENKNLDGEEIKKGVAEALVAKALDGDVQAIKEIGNRIDGMPQQFIDHTSKGEQVLIKMDIAEEPEST